MDKKQKDRMGKLIRLAHTNSGATPDERKVARARLRELTAKYGKEYSREVSAKDRLRRMGLTR